MFSPVIDKRRAATVFAALLAGGLHLPLSLRLAHRAIADTAGETGDGSAA